MATKQVSSDRPTLQSLPAEIRNKILALALKHRKPLEAFTAIGHRNGRYYSYPSPPPVARVSRQMREEALPAFYGVNTFEFVEPDLLTFGSTDGTFAWYKGLHNYQPNLPKFVRSMVVIQQPWTITITYVDDDDSSIDIAVHYVPHTARLFNIAFCICRYKEMATRLIKTKGRFAKTPLFIVAETLRRSMISEQEVITIGTSRTCRDTLACGKLSTEKTFSWRMSCE